VLPGTFDEAPEQLVDGNPGDLIHLSGIRPAGAPVATDQDVVELIFKQIGGKLVEIDEGTDLFEGGAYAHLFLQPLGGSLEQRLTCQGVGATGVGPKTTGMVFARGAPLQQKQRNIRRVVDGKDGEGAMQIGHGMSGRLIRAARLAVMDVDQYEVFGHSCLHSAVL
jgi:hypothetical protein